MRMPCAVADCLKEYSDVSAPNQMSPPLPAFVHASCTSCTSLSLNAPTQTVVCLFSFYSLDAHYLSASAGLHGIELAACYVGRARPDRHSTLRVAQALSGQRSGIRAVHWTAQSVEWS